MGTSSKGTCGERCLGCVTDKGNVSLVLSVIIVTMGSLCLFVTDVTNVQSQAAGRYLMSIGLFAFSGGLTNWIAIQMLFYKIPLVYGSGVLHNRYKNIRRAMKDMILGTFFQPEFLNTYIPQKLREAVSEADLEMKINAFLTSDTGQRMIDEKLDKMANSPDGRLAETMVVNVGKFKPVVKPVIVSFLSDLAPNLVNYILESKTSSLNLHKLRDELNRYMSERMLEVTPKMIKEIMYAVVLQYLGWLVVWGVVFGSAMGAICEAASFAPNYTTWSNLAIIQPLKTKIKLAKIIMIVNNDKLIKRTRKVMDCPTG
eukprot:sb/3467011/